MPSLLGLTDEERKKLREQRTPELLKPQSGLIYNSGGIKPFDAGIAGNPISEEAAGSIRNTFPPTETTQTVANYPYGQNKEGLANIASQYRPQDNLLLNIPANIPPVEVLQNQPTPTTGRRDIFGQPWKEQPISPWAFSQMSTLEKSRAGDLPSRLEMEFSPPSGTTRGGKYLKRESEEKKAFMDLLAAEGASRGGMESARIGAESREEVGLLRSEAMSENARVRTEAQDKLNAYREASLEQKSKKITGNVVRDKTSPTGYSYVDESGNIISKGAPMPSVYKPGKTGAVSGGKPTIQQKNYEVYLADEEKAGRTPLSFLNWSTEFGKTKPKGGGWRTPAGAGAKGYKWEGGKLVPN